MGTPGEPMGVPLDTCGHTAVTPREVDSALQGPLGKHWERAGGRSGASSDVHRRTVYAALYNHPSVGVLSFKVLFPVLLLVRSIPPGFGLQKTMDRWTQQENDGFSHYCRFAEGRHSLQLVTQSIVEQPTTDISWR